MDQQLLTGARVVTATGTLDPGWVHVRDGRIAAVGSGEPASEVAAAAAASASGGSTQLRGAWVLPGFIDLHVHGGGGHDVARSPVDLLAALAFHRARGTTRTLVSFVTAPLASLAEQLGWVAALVEDGGGPQGLQVVGSHLEGPFLAPARCGAQAPQHLLAPDRHALADLVSAARGTLRSVTIAPELPQALSLIGDIRAAGALAAIGHTDASYAQALAGFAAGAGLATHLFNGMRPLHHRDPGAAGAALDAGVPCEVVNDGVHLHPSIVRLVARRPEHLVLITDAIDGAGAGDGDYRLGGRAVTVRDGVARLAGAGSLAGSLAGSTLTMDAALRRAVVECGLPIEVAAAAASSNPARALGLSQVCGAISPGLAADLVVLDADLRLNAVMVAGSWDGGAYVPRTLGDQ